MADIFDIFPYQGDEYDPDIKWNLKTVHPKLVFMEWNKDDPCGIDKLTESQQTVINELVSINQPELWYGDVPILTCKYVAGLRSNDDDGVYRYTLTLNYTLQFEGDKHNLYRKLGNYLNNKRDTKSLGGVLYGFDLEVRVGTDSSRFDWMRLAPFCDELNENMVVPFINDYYINSHMDRSNGTELSKETVRLAGDSTYLSIWKANRCLMRTDPCMCVDAGPYSSHSGKEYNAISFWYDDLITHYVDEWWKVIHQRYGPFAEHCRREDNRAFIRLNLELMNQMLKVNNGDIFEIKTLKKSIMSH